MPEYLVRLAQIHESFRKAELHALAEIAGVELEIVSYDDDVGILCFRILALKFSLQEFVFLTWSYAGLKLLTNTASHHTASSASHPMRPPNK